MIFVTYSNWSVNSDAVQQCIYRRNMRKTRTTRIVETRYWKCVSKYYFFWYRNIIKWWIYSNSDPKPHLSRAHRSQSHHIILVSMALYLLLYHMRLVSLKDKRKRKPTTFVFFFAFFGIVLKWLEGLGRIRNPKIRLIVEL